MENGCVKSYLDLVRDGGSIEEMRTALDKYPKVIISEDTYGKIALFAHRKAMAKEAEAKEAWAAGEKNQYGYDNRRMYPRFITGTLGEVGLQGYMKSLSPKVKDFVDWGIGNSKDFNVPDIPQYNIGIKSAKIGNVPLVPLRNNEIGQIIIIIDEQIDQNPVIYILGFATPDILNKYNSLDWVVDTRCKYRKTKGGFYGLDKLQPVNSIL